MTDPSKTTTATPNLPTSTATPHQQQHQNSIGANPTDNTQTFTSNDPTTHRGNTVTQKLTGDAKGAAAGVVGSLQAATGTMLRNDKMAEKGFEKMNTEDQRLAAKSGKPPVGGGTRGTVETVGGTGVGAVGNQSGQTSMPAAGEEINTGTLKNSGAGI